jgi:hypothetical protein
MAKKSFKDDINPAMRFISQPTIEAPIDRKKETAKEGYKLNPLYVETKSRRLQLLLQPSLYEKIKARSQHEGKSINELVRFILEGALEGE